MDAPDFIVEVVSPSSKRIDYHIKLFKYRTARVREYWIVDPLKNLITTYNFEGENTEIYTFADKIKLGIYEDLEIHLLTSNSESPYFIQNIFTMLLLYLFMFSLMIPTSFLI